MTVIREAKEKAQPETEVFRLVHSQVLRIREEDSHLRKDIAEGFNMKNESGYIKVVMDEEKGIREMRIRSPCRKLLADSALDFVFVMRPILPCSPLSGRSTAKAFL